MIDKRSVGRWALAALALAVLAIGPAHAQERRGEGMVAAANPLAVEAALEMLREGGTAVDAAIAAEMVLGLVEPQSSGIGGGGFLLFYDGRSEAIQAYDGRERAPAGARPDMFLDAQGRPPARLIDAQATGRAIGTPLLAPMLKLAHDDHGRLPWRRLFEPAIRLAEQGFPVSPRMAGAIARYGPGQPLQQDPEARAYFFTETGAPLPAGALLRNPSYARTLRVLAGEGPRALTRGAIAEAIVAAAQRPPGPGTLAIADLERAQPRRLSPVCARFRTYRACTMGPPSSANAMLAILGLYERARPTPAGADSADDWSAFLWASRLSYADRDHYMADDDFELVPTRQLISPSYLDARARLIDVLRAPGRRVEPGMPAGRSLFERWGRDTSDDAGTTHMSIVDGYGNAVALTATIEGAFGSQRMTWGFLLNNQLTDFSATPSLNGRPVANAVEARKRPRSSMSPLIVTDAEGELVFVNGSAGGSAIIGYVARSTIGVLDWGLTPQQAIDDANMVARLAPVSAELGRMRPGLANALSSRGWEMRDAAGEPSGLHAILVTPSGLVGGADSRREGVVGRAPAR